MSTIIYNPPAEGELRPLMTTKEICAWLNTSVSTLRRLRYIDDFPQPVMRGKRAHGWVQAEVAEWFMNRRVKGR